MKYILPVIGTIMVVAGLTLNYEGDFPEVLASPVLVVLGMLLIFETITGKARRGK